MRPGIILPRVSEALHIPLVIVGAGAAGLAAAIAAGEADPDLHPLVLEKNDQPGVKLLISGGGRCNVTADASAREVADAFGTGGKFLMNSLGAFPPDRIRQWLEEEGVPTHVEPPRKVFPDSGKARDVVEALLTRARRAGARISCGQAVTALSKEGNLWKLDTAKGPLIAERIILTAGGASYPKTGTSGDAYAWLEALGHTLPPLRPALVPWSVPLPWVRDLSGLTLEDATVTLDVKGHPTERGGFLFTHQGISGPAPMNLSRHLPPASKGPFRILLDPMPDVEEKSLPEMIRAWRLPIPARLAEALRPEGKPMHWTRAQLLETARHLKAVPIQPAAPMGYDKAEVTQGGVALSEVDPKTMASRKVPGLFVAGELLDLDGPIGGYNLAAAWATGWAAGQGATL